MPALRCAFYRAAALRSRRAGGVAPLRRLTAASSAPPPPDAVRPPPPLSLYNSASRSKEVFSPRPEQARALARRATRSYLLTRAQGNRVSMYVCGVTVYDYRRESATRPAGTFSRLSRLSRRALHSHIGHARAYVAFDTLLRALRRRGLDVFYARNFTDVDDKIIRRAAEAGVTCDALTAQYISEFTADMAALRVAPPDAEPRATEHVGDIVAMIARIIANGHAYALPGGDVYFEVATLPSYGSLSGRGGADNRAGERVAVDARKRGAADFALWKAAKPGEPSWDAPWGPGRPGWHIECSAMAEALFGPTIDIHGGGADLLFPHHENEAAQSAAAAGGCGCGGNAWHSHAHSGGGGGTALINARPPPSPGMARFWVHNGFVNVGADVKMSKSLGNFATIRDVLARYAPTALRLFLLGTHYRAAITFSQTALEEASDRAFYIYSTLADADAAVASSPLSPPSSPPPKPGPAAEAALALAASLPDACDDATSDDLNTPVLLAHLSPALKAANELTGGAKAARRDPGKIPALRALSASIRTALDHLGLSDRGDPLAELAALRAAALVRAGMDEGALRAKMEERAALRAAGDFDAADAVRAQLAAVGVSLTDGAAGGPGWKPAPPVPLPSQELTAAR